MAVFGFGRRNAVGRQYNGGNVSVMLPRYTTPPERNTRDWLEMFGRNPRLAVVDRIASDLSTCAGKLYRKDENGEEVEITDHPFLNFMAHPNPLYEMTWGACWRLQQIYLELKGEGYFVYEFDALGRPVELWPLPTHWVQQTPYVGYPYYEIRTTGGLIRQIPVDDIFCMKELNPLDPYKRGLGAAESLADEIETDEYAAKFQKKFFYNDATPTTLISMPGSSKDQRDRFRSEWNERFRGPFNSHGIATVDGNVTVTKLAENMRDMDMTEGRRFLRDAVLEHFGVPREIMGITESSNRATSEAAQKAQRAKFEVATMKFFRQQQKRLSGALSGTEKADWSVWDVLMPYITENHVEDSAAWSALGEQEQKNLVEQFIGGLINWPSEETAMEEIFKPLWKQTYDEGTRIAKQAYNIRGVDRPELLSQAKLHGGQRVRHVTQTTKENISRIVANGIEAGIGREKMADEILQEYEIQTRSRARLIADQETVMTLETGHYDMMQKSGATTKTWHHRPQKNPRDGSDGGPNHVKMDGETVPIDARFSNGLRYPCDPEGPARETIKCRCYVTYNR